MVVPRSSMQCLYLVTGQGAYNLHGQHSQVLQEGDPLAQSGTHSHLHMHTKHGTSQRT